jgi:hypothetical protein
MNIPEIVIAIFLKKIYAINMHEHEHDTVSTGIEGNKKYEILF